MQIYIHETEEYVAENKMVINNEKTDAMIFTNSRFMDFPPELFFKDGTLLKTVAEKTLLGVIVTSDLEWARKLWIIKKGIRAFWESLV